MSTSDAEMTGPWPEKKLPATLLILIILVFLVGSCGLFLPCFEHIGDANALDDSINNLHQIGVALQDYHAAFGRLPPAVVRGKQGKSLYSWRVLLLPHLEQNSLFLAFHKDEPWDSPHNKQFLLRMPKVYQTPILASPVVGQTHYQVFVGPGTAFERDGLTFGDFPDGTINTLAVVEAAEPVPWTKPADLVYTPDRPLPALGVGFARPVRFLCREIGYERGFNVCFADGAVRFLPQNFDEAALRAYITRNGGEKVDRPRRP